MPDESFQHRRRVVSRITQPRGDFFKPRMFVRPLFRRRFRCLLAGLFLLACLPCARPQGSTVTIQANQPAAAISSNLFGIFFEEINMAGDGGIYSELVRNRSFEDATT